MRQQERFGSMVPEVQNRHGRLLLDVSGGRLVHGKEHERQQGERESCTCRPLSPGGAVPRGEDPLEGEQLKAIGLLTASLAHEFSNPLCGVSSVLDRMVRKPGLPEVEQELLRLAQQQCTRMRQLMQALQEFIPVPSEGRTTFDLHQAIASVLQLVRKPLQISRISLRSLHDSTPLFLDGAEGQIKLLLLHLFQCSCHHLAPDGATITMGTELDGPWVRIAIRFEVAADRSGAMAALFASLIAFDSSVGSGRSLLQTIVEAHGGVLHQPPSPPGGGALVISLPVGGE